MMHQRKKRTTRQEQIQKILEELRGTKNVSDIKSAKERIFIPKVKKQKKVKPSTHEKAFQMYSLHSTKTFMKTKKVRSTKKRRKQSRATKTMKECLINSTPSQYLQKTRSKMRSTASRKVKQKTALEYELNSSKIALTRRREKSETSSTKSYDKKTSTPKSWRKIRIQVIYKKGDREDPSIYRPICSLPVLYKLFATVLYARLAPSLNKIQLPDQGGFRPSHRSEDHLMVYRVLEQRFREWGAPLYISRIDLTKAFGRIKYSAPWSSLQHYGVEPTYVRLLQILYSHQEGTVVTDKESDMFPSKGETKQRTHCRACCLTQYYNFLWRVI